MLYGTLSSRENEKTVLLLVEKGTLVQSCFFKKILKNKFCTINGLEIQKLHFLAICTNSPCRALRAKKRKLSWLFHQAKWTVRQDAAVRLLKGGTWSRVSHQYTWCSALHDLLALFSQPSTSPVPLDTSMTANSVNNINPSVSLSKLAGQAIPISTMFNNPRTDSETCVQPLTWTRIRNQRGNLSTVNSDR